MPALPNHGFTRRSPYTRVCTGIHGARVSRANRLWQNKWNGLTGFTGRQLKRRTIITRPPERGHGRDQSRLFPNASVADKATIDSLGLSSASISCLPPNPLPRSNSLPRIPVKPLPLPYSTGRNRMAIKMQTIRMWYRWAGVAETHGACFATPATLLGKPR